ncbi:MAG: ADP-ribosylglycohydrolase family protein [Opitutales bacterium]
MTQSAAQAPARPELDAQPAGMLAGLFIGDALAMPVHWYYDPEALRKDYGEVRAYLAPRNPHPFSILWRSSYKAPNPRGEILHDQVRYWGQRDVHYHQFQKAGENTLTAKLCRLLWQSLHEDGGWNPDAYLQRYIAYLTTPGTHNDTYLEECHRDFFANYARGAEPRQCATEEKHIAGLAALFPILAHETSDLASARAHALERLELTHPGHRMRWAANLMLDLFDRVHQGTHIQEAATQLLPRVAKSVSADQWQHLLSQNTTAVLNRAIGTVCYVEQAVPAILYLLCKHGEDPEQALIENTHAGGDNVHRGAVLGALLGYAHGIDAWPQRWREGLVEGLPFSTQT